MSQSHTEKTHPGQPVPAPMPMPATSVIEDAVPFAPGPEQMPGPNPLAGVTPAGIAEAGTRVAMDDYPAGRGGMQMAWFGLQEQTAPSPQPHSRIGPMPPAV